MLDPDISIDNYKSLCCVRNRQEEGVVCYVRNDLGYTTLLFFSREVENIFFEIVQPKLKPTTVGTTYHPPSQRNFLELLNEIYILGDFNRNVLNNKSVHSDVKSYREFYTNFGLKQLMKVPTRVTSSSSRIIEHILASFPKRVTQSGVTDIGLSDHQLIYCTRKTSKIKRGSHKQMKFHSFKHHKIDLFEQELSKLN